MARPCPDVHDVWSDAGSVPFARLHGPFENGERFGEPFPADSIVDCATRLGEEAVRIDLAKAE